MDHSLDNPLDILLGVREYLICNIAMLVFFLQFCSDNVLVEFAGIMF